MPVTLKCPDCGHAAAAEDDTPRLPELRRHHDRPKWGDRRTGRTVRQTGSRTEHHFGFLGVADVRDVETLVHDVLLHGGGDEGDED